LEYDLLSNKPIENLLDNKIIKLNKEINFEKSFNHIYNEYYKFYVNYRLLLILNNRTILENMFLGKKYENGINLYFSLNNKVDYNYYFYFY